MSRGVAGSMSLLGFITEPSLKLDRAVTWFFASRRNQCIVLREIEGYVYVREINQGTHITPETFCDYVAESLQRVLIKYFDQVYVDATPYYPKENVTTMFTCYISCTAVQGDKRYDLAKSVLLNNKTYELINKARHEVNNADQ